MSRERLPQSPWQSSWLRGRSSSQRAHRFLQAFSLLKASGRSGAGWTIFEALQAVNVPDARRIAGIDSRKYHFVPMAQMSGCEGASLRLIATDEKPASIRLFVSFSGWKAS